MRSALVVVPTYKEAASILPLIRAVLTALPEADLLVVDDGSPDGTADAVEGEYGRCPRVSLWRRTGPRGLGRSYREAFQRALKAGYPRVLQMDADLSHDPRYLPRLLQAAQEADVVIGSRYCPGGGVCGWPLRRRLLSRTANLYLRATLHLGVADATSGYRCYTRRALEAIGLEHLGSRGYAFQVEMTCRARRAGLRIQEVPITFVERLRGHSKLSAAILAEAALLPWRLRAAGLRAPAPASRVLPRSRGTGPP